MLSFDFLHWIAKLAEVKKIQLYPGLVDCLNVDPQITNSYINYRSHVSCKCTYFLLKKDFMMHMASTGIYTVKYSIMLTRFHHKEYRKS